MDLINHRRKGYVRIISAGNPFSFEKYDVYTLLYRTIVQTLIFVRIDTDYKAGYYGPYYS